MVTFVQDSGVNKESKIAVTKFDLPFEFLQHYIIKMYLSRMFEIAKRSFNNEKVHGTQVPHLVCCPDVKQEKLGGVCIKQKHLSQWN